MAFLDLVFNLTALAKLADRDLVPADLRQVIEAAPVVTMPNPNPRAAGSLLVVGPTPLGRFITFVVEPDAADDGRWHVRTAWDSTSAQRALYRTVLGGG